MRYVLLQLTFLAVTFGLAYFETISRLAKGCFTYKDAHGLMIFAVSLYMIWTKRGRLKTIPKKPNLLFGSGLTILGCSMLISGKLSGTVLLQDFSLILTLMGLIWLFMGSQYLKALWVPVGYLTFMFPLIEDLLGNVSIYLQLVAAWIGSLLLKLSGMPVFLSAQFIELPHITLEVARACNGIHHIIALVALAIPLAFVTQKTWIRIGLFIMFAFFVGIFANGLRVALIGIWSAYHRSGSLHGPFDILYVSFIVFFGIFLLLFTSVVTKRGQLRKASAQAMESSTEGIGHHGSVQRLIGGFRRMRHELFCREGIKRLRPLLITPRESLQDSEIQSPNPGLRLRGGCNSRSLAVALVILLAASAYLYLYKPRPVDLTTPLTSFPTRVGDWTGYDVAVTDSPFARLAADLEVHRVYYDLSGNEIRLYIGYFAWQEQGKEMVDSDYSWLHYQGEAIRVPLECSVVTVKKSRPRRKENLKAVYFWYDINGRIIIDRYRAKLATVQDAFEKRRTNGAIVVISTEKNSRIQPKAELQFIKTILPIARVFLNKI